MKARIRELEAQIEALSARVAQLTQQVYGHKSKRQAAKAKSAADDLSVQTGGHRGQQAGAKGHGRRRYTNLPAEEEVHEIPEENRHCLQCGLPYAPFPGEETSEEIDWQGKLVRKVHKRQRYQKTCQCPGVKAIITAPAPPKVIAKGLFTAGFIARLLVEKFVLTVTAAATSPWPN